MAGIILVMIMVVLLMFIVILKNKKIAITISIAVLGLYHFYVVDNYSSNFNDSKVMKTMARR